MKLSNEILNVCINVGSLFANSAIFLSLALKALKKITKQAK